MAKKLFIAAFFVDAERFDEMTGAGSPHKDDVMALLENQLGMDGDVTDFAVWDGTDNTVVLLKEIADAINDSRRHRFEEH
jgi:hypothetical protein